MVLYSLALTKGPGRAGNGGFCMEMIAIVGAGAMGCYYASKFYSMDPQCVCLVARGRRYDRLLEEGILVNSRQYYPRVVEPKHGAGPFDLVMCCVKNHQLPEAIGDMRYLVGEGTSVISVMNGIDSERQIGEALGMEKVLYAVAVGIDAVREGKAVTYSKEGRLLFGEAVNKVLSERVVRLQGLFTRAGIPHDTPADMIRALWWKFMVNVGMNQFSALLRAPYGVFQESADAKALCDMAMGEVIEVAVKEGVSLGREDMKEWHGILMGLSPTGKTSMLQDMEAGRKTEVEMFAGRVVELGLKHGLPTPVNLMLLRCIRVLEGLQGRAS
jgi:2-dehydropantoate 2-reductase